MADDHGIDPYQWIIDGDNDDPYFPGEIAQSLAKQFDEFLHLNGMNDSDAAQAMCNAMNCFASFLEYSKPAWSDDFSEDEKSSVRRAFCFMYAMGVETMRLQLITLGKREDGAALIEAMMSENAKETIARIGRAGGLARIENSLQEHAKEGVFAAWKKWINDSEQYGKRNSQADFSRAMLLQWDGILVSQETIKRWCREWPNGENLPLKYRED